MKTLELIKHVLLPGKGSLTTQWWRITAVEKLHINHLVFLLSVGGAAQVATPPPRRRQQCEWQPPPLPALSGRSRLWCPILRKRKRRKTRSQIVLGRWRRKHQPASIPLFVCSNIYAFSLSLARLCLRWFPRAKYFWTIFIIFIQLKPPRLYEM